MLFKSYNSHLRNLCGHIVISPILQMGKLKRQREVKSLAHGHPARKKPSGIWTQVSGAKIQYYTHTVNDNEVFGEGEIPWPILQKEILRLEEIPSSLFLDIYFIYIYTPTSSLYIHIYVSGKKKFQPGSSLLFLGPLWSTAPNLSLFMDPSTIHQPRNKRT